MTMSNTYATGYCTMLRRMCFMVTALLCLTPAMTSAMEIGLGHISHTITDDSQPGAGDTMRLAAPRGGHATGVIVVRGAPAAAQARLSRDGLRQGRAHQLDDAVQILYGSRRTDFGPDRGQDDSHSGYYDTLTPVPVDETRVLPIYVHIAVPQDAQPGSYTGTIEVRGRGASKEFDLQVEVSPFVLPPPQERRAWVDMLQSPDSVAYRYGVPLYSRQHLQLMRPVMEMMANLGQQAMHVTTIARTNFGNDEAMIPIGQQGIDFSGFEGYLSLFNETIGAPRFVIVYAVERGGSTGSGSAAPHWTPPGGQRQGSTDPVKVAYSDRYRPAWQAAMKGIQQRIERAGWNDTEILIGWIGDARPFGDYLAFFGKVAPFARWVQFTHARSDPPPNAQGKLQMLGMDVAYRVLPYPPTTISGGSGRPRAPAPRGGWNSPFLNVTSMRGNNNQYQNPAYWLGQVPHAVSDDHNPPYRGIARIGMDFWPVPQPDGGSGRLLKRFQRWHNLQRDTAPALIAPGPEGALPTVRYLAMWQGIQETEARILAEMALAARRLPRGVNQQQAEGLLEAWRALRKVDAEIMGADNEAEILSALYHFASFVQDQL